MNSTNNNNEDEYGNRSNNSNDNDTKTETSLLVVKSVSSLAKLVKDLQNQLKEVQDQIKVLQIEQEELRDDKRSNSNNRSSSNGNTTSRSTSEEDSTKKRRRDLIKMYKSFLSIVKASKMKQEGGDTADKNTIILQNIAHKLSDFDECCSLLSSPSIQEVLVSPQHKIMDNGSNNVFQSIPGTVPITPASTGSLGSIPQVPPSPQRILQHGNGVDKQRSSSGERTVTIKQQQYQMEECDRTVLSKNTQSNKCFVFVHFSMTLMLAAYFIVIHFDLPSESLLNHSTFYRSSYQKDGPVYDSKLEYEKNKIARDGGSNSTYDDGQLEKTVITSNATTMDTSSVTNIPPFWMVLEENKCATGPQDPLSNSYTMIDESSLKVENAQNHTFTDEIEEERCESSDATINCVQSQESSVTTVIKVSPSPSLTLKSATSQVQKRGPRLESIPKSIILSKSNINIPHIISRAYLCDSFEDSTIISTVSQCKYQETTIEPNTFEEAKKRNEQRERAFSELRENKLLRRVLFRKQLITAITVGGILLFPKFFSSFHQIRRLIFGY
mmetsp:Transcript_24941/g.37286  ORF Transcript_24941/g.37286 Transcript_24941/m.37286 type:complete len:554 (+) Transcript_24941:130-1791(+)